MKYKYKISVIVPARNSEPYIKKCLDSLLDQSFDSYEIIIIENCSDDNTLKICQEYQDNNENIKLFTNNEASAAKAKNIGLKNIQGEYVVFCDSDDYVSNTYLSNLFKAITENETDIAIGGYNYQKDGETTVNPAPCQGHYYANNPQLDLTNFSTFGACWKIYKASIINDNRVAFPTLKVFEDSLFNVVYLKYAKKCTIVSDVDYYYIYNPASITSNMFNDFDEGLERIREYYYGLVEYLNADMGPINDYDNYLHYELLNIVYALLLKQTEIGSISKEQFSKLGDFLRIHNLKSRTIKPHVSIVLNLIKTGNYKLAMKLMDIRTKIR